MKKGTVKFFDKTRDFGFITEDAKKKDIYFDGADVEGGQKLDTGDRVKFDVEKKGKKMKAVNIIKIL